MKKVNSKIIINQNVPIANVDTIAEDVAFIKITVLFPECFDAVGNIDNGKVRDVVRGIWRIRNVQKRNRIKYLMAIYRGHIVGCFRVKWVSRELPQAFANGLQDFPAFPADVRQWDRWKAQFATIAQAQQGLSTADFKLFVASITRKNASVQHVLDLYRERVYFSVDDDVPSHLIKFVGCRIKRTVGLGGKILSDRMNPVITNF